MLSYRLLALLLILPVIFLSLTCSRHNTDEIRQGEVLFAEAGRQEDQFNYSKAEELYREAAALFRANSMETLESDVYAALGSMDHAAGNFQQSIEYFTHAAELAQGSGDHGRHVAALISIAAIDSQLGQLDLAIAVAKQSTMLSDMYGYQEGVIAGYASLGRKYSAAGLFRQATESFSKVRNAAQILNNPKEDFSAALSLCEVAVKEGRVIDALQSLATLEPGLETQPGFTHRLYLDQATAFMGIADYQSAVGAYAHAIESDSGFSTRNRIITLLGAAEAEYLLRRFADATQLCSNALDIARTEGDRIAEAAILVHIGDIARYQNPAAAAESYQGAVELFTALNYPGGMAYALHHYGKTVEAGGNFTSAVDLYRQALAAYDEAISTSSDPTIDQRLQWTHRSQTTSIANDLARNLLLLNNPEEAFVTYEHGLCTEFALLMQTVGLKPRAENLVHHYDRVRQLSAEIRAIHLEQVIEVGKHDDKRDEAKIVRLETVFKSKSGERADAIREIESEDPNSSFTFDVKDIGLQELQSHIPGGAVLLEYIPAEINLYCAVVTRTSFSVRRIPSSYPAILQRADEFKRALNTPSTPRERESGGDEALYKVHMLGRSLYNDLLGSLQVPGLSQAEIVVVLPDGLSDIPVHALVEPGVQTTGDFVADRQLIRYLPFASASMFQSNQKHILFDIVAIGDPEVTNWEVDYVLRDIKTFFKDAKLFIGTDATSGNLFETSGDVLHIATDFLYDANYPRNSYLSLRKPGGTDYIPVGSLHELYNFPCVIIMNVGPSIESVNRFHMALLLSNGSECVIGTFWQPERGAVRAFDEQFYSSLANRMSPDDAYLQAQKEMIAMPIFRPPHQWAPFYYFGIH